LAPTSLMLTKIYQHDPITISPLLVYSENVLLIGATAS